MVEITEKKRNNAIIYQLYYIINDKNDKLNDRMIGEIIRIHLIFLLILF